MRSVLFKDLEIGSIFYIYNRCQYQKLKLSYDFHGAYNAVSITDSHAKEYISDDESVLIDD
jgi:hypothetical protein